MLKTILICSLGLSIIPAAFANSAGQSCTTSTECTCPASCHGSTGPNLPGCTNGQCTCNCANP